MLTFSKVAVQTGHPLFCLPVTLDQFFFGDDELKSSYF